MKRNAALLQKPGVDAHVLAGKPRQLPIKMTIQTFRVTGMNYNIKDVAAVPEPL